MRANTYFSAFVRIQEERGHVVVDQGPCRTIRHPGNLSMITPGCSAYAEQVRYRLLPGVW